MSEKAIVLRSTGLWYELKKENGQYCTARLRGKIRLQGLKVTNPIAVGDWVSIDKESENDESICITDILQRRNYVIRKSTHKKNHAHLIAANIDVAALLVTLFQPRTSTGFIDRFLVSAETFRIPAVLLFNKSDLLNEEEKQIQASIMKIYQEIGYECFAISAIENTGIDRIREFLKGKTTLLSGHSGAGKSTLLNVVCPSAAQHTKSISDFSQKGVHTTTFAEMFEAEGDMRVIDTPGIKEMGLFEVGKEELSHYFPEMRARIGTCKYYNCTHVHEPSCAILESVKSGEIAFSRYQSYLSMFRDEDNRK